MISPVVYRTALPLNRGGLGTIAWYACHALMKEGLLHRVLAPEVGAAGLLAPFAHGLPFPFRQTMAIINRLGWHYWKDSFFDRWASSWIQPGMDYYGWMHQSLTCIRKCHHLGGRTFVDRGSVEPRLQQRWLKEEYIKHGLRIDPIAPLTLQRMIQEGNETDIIVVPSSLVKNSYLAAGYKEKHLHINPLGVEIKDSSPLEVKKKEDVVRFVFVGQLSIQKGIPDLLQIWQRFARSNSELVLAGTIPPQEITVIQPLIKKCRRIRWNGHCHDVSALLKTCDVLLLPSAQDGFGLVVLEAFACGLPVIISDRVGAKDCVSEGKNGFIFRFGNQSALEEKLEWFCSDLNRSRSMRTATFETAKHYSWESYGQRFTTLFKS